MIRNATTAQAKIKTQIFNADGSPGGGNDWIGNLVFDSGLNDLANARGFADFFRVCKLGSASDANSIPTPGAVTVSQSGTAVTASASFFTAAMVGSILKYGASGSGGVEVYITGYTSGTAVTVGTSATVASTAATVWRVGRTGLVSYINLKSNTYETTGGGCGYTVVSGNVVLTRTFYFAAQGSPYTVNEIGYGYSNAADAVCNGRVVLPSSDVVGTTQYYLVTIAITFAISPVTQVALANVGTNINVGGDAIFCFYDCHVVNPATGNSDGYQNLAHGVSGQSFYMDAGNQSFNNVALLLSTFSLPAATSTGAETPAYRPYILACGLFSNSGGVGISRASGTFTLTTSGETLYGFEFGSGGNVQYTAETFKLKLTTPITLPTGIFAGSLTLENRFSRTLSN